MFSQIQVIGGEANSTCFDTLVGLPLPFTLLVLSPAFIIDFIATPVARIVQWAVSSDPVSTTYARVGLPGLGATYSDRADALSLIRCVAVYVGCGGFLWYWWWGLTGLASTHACGSAERAVEMALLDCLQLGARLRPMPQTAASPQSSSQPADGRFCIASCPFQMPPISKRPCKRLTSTVCACCAVLGAAVPPSAGPC